MAAIWAILLVISYVFIGIILVGVERRWGFPYSFMAMTDIKLDEEGPALIFILVLAWPIAVLYDIIGFVVLMIFLLCLFIMNGFKWKG